MKEITVGEKTLRLVTVQRDGAWHVHAERVDTGDQYGPDVGGDSESEAVMRLERWLEWQNEHASALEALQRAENAYHRTIAGSAFVSPTEGPSAVELQKDALDALEAARVRLDDIRAQKP